MGVLYNSIATGKTYRHGILFVVIQDENTAHNLSFRRCHTFDGTWNELTLLKIREKNASRSENGKTDASEARRMHLLEIEQRFNVIQYWFVVTRSERWASELPPRTEWVSESSPAKINKNHLKQKHRLLHHHHYHHLRHRHHHRLRTKPYIIMRKCTAQRSMAHSFSSRPLNGNKFRACDSNGKCFRIFVSSA